MNRNTLIAYSLKHQGEYFKMLQDIRNLTPIEDVYLPGCLTILDDDYPKELFHLHYPPLVLYYVGNLSLLKKSKIGIVGSRKPCDYAIAATRNLARRYQDEVIVSGLAKGIDAIAHLNSQKTIGILVCGIRRYYPYANKVQIPTYPIIHSDLMRSSIQQDTITHSDINRSDSPYLVIVSM